MTLTELKQAIILKMVLALRQNMTNTAMFYQNMQQISREIPMFTINMAIM